MSTSRPLAKPSPQSGWPGERARSDSSSHSGNGCSTSPGNSQTQPRCLLSTAYSWRFGAGLGHVVWAYVLVLFIFNDRLKLIAYRLLDVSDSRHRTPTPST